MSESDDRFIEIFWITMIFICSYYIEIQGVLMLEKNRGYDSFRRKITCDEQQ